MALLSVDNLSVSFVTRNGTNQAVDNVSFSVEERQITAIIGESGSGKSVSCYAMLGLVPSPPGRIDGGKAHFQGQDLLALSEDELRAIRGRDITMIFQDPMTCLNPFMKIGDQLIEPLTLHKGLVKGPARERAAAIYKELRANLVGNMRAEWEETGYLWEQYNPQSGRGQRTHPFNGWSSLALLALAEIY